MSDFYGALLTTSFRVKDPVAYAADPEVQHFVDKAQEARFGVAMPVSAEDYTSLGWDDQYPSTSSSLERQTRACKTCSEDVAVGDDEYGNLREHLAQHHGGAYNLSTKELDECFEEETDSEFTYELTDAIQRHIHPDDVCQIQVSGAEKLRYVGGEIAFVTDKGTVWFPFGETDWRLKHTKASLHDVIVNHSFENNLGDLIDTNPNEEQP